MARPPLSVGTAGKISFATLNGTVRAKALFRDFDGVTRPVARFGPTKAAAERALKEALRDRTGPLGESITADTRLSVLAQSWRSEIEVADHLSDGSRETYLRTLDKHVLRGMGGLRLRECDVPTVDRFLKTVRRSHGAGAAKNAKTVTSLLLGLAVRHGALPTNPVRDTEKVRRGRAQRPRALSEPESIDLVKRISAEAASDAAGRQGDELDLADICEWMLGTGMRIGETLAVRRSALDIEAGVFEVNATVVRVKGKGAVLQLRTKSDAGWRVIALPDHVVGIATRRMDMSWPKNEHGLLFPTPLGEVRNTSNVQRGLKTVLGRIGEYEWVTSHTFRKTVATRLDEAGLSARAIADHLGHARPSMTQDVYMGRGVASAEAAQALTRTAK